MDSRDIKENPRPLADNEVFAELYRLQLGLIDNYVSIEGLPSYPVNVNTKDAQILLKDFTGRVIEELSEGFQAYEEVSNITEQNQLWWNGGSHFNKQAYVEMLNHLQNANEEQADALHFFLELLIYANIYPDDIHAYLNKYIQDKIAKHIVFNSTGKSLEQLIELDTLNKAMLIGEIMLSNNFLHETPYRTNLLNNLDGITSIEIGHLLGGSCYHKLVYSNLKYMLWDISHHLNISRNYLKNKPWKQTQMMTQELYYQQELVTAFVMMLGYFKYLGIDVQNLYFLYFKKNMVNQFRIKSKY